MDPFTALLVIAASHGASALVQALGGSTQWSSLAGDLVKALDDSESRIVEHLTEIELKLDELITRRYKLDEINEGYAKLKEGNVLRHLVDFGVAT